MHTRNQEAIIPAQIFITKRQVAAMYELDEDVIVTEAHPEAEALDVWVMDEDALNSNTHRSVVMDREGTILADELVGDF